MGQLLGLLIIIAIIYFPFIKPLTVLHAGNLIFRCTPSESKLSKQKYFAIIIAFYHLALSLSAFIFVIVRSFKSSKNIENSIYVGYFFFAMAILGVITICFGVTLFPLLKRKNNTENVLKLGFILPTHSGIGILCSFWLGGELFFNLDQKIIGVLLFCMLIVEAVYIFAVYRFQKQNGILWQHPKATTHGPEKL